MSEESFEDFVRRIPDFSALSPTDKICHAAWYLHAAGQQFVTTRSINTLFAQIHAVPPPTAVYLKRLAERRPPTFLKSKSGYKLENSPRNALTEKLAPKSETAVVGALLTGLVAKLGVAEEARFLDEALRCYSVRAFRASIVMTWNLAFDHVQQWVIADPSRIERLNQSIKDKYPKKMLVVKVVDDLSEMKEYEIIACLYHSKLITKNVSDILQEKLKRRNAAAHPSSIVITQAQADDVITDLINNVILRLN